MYRKNSNLPYLEMKTLAAKCVEADLDQPYNLTNNVIRWRTPGFILAWGQADHRLDKAA